MGDSNHGTMDRICSSYDLGIHVVDSEPRNSTLGLANRKCIVHDMGIRRHKGQGHCTRINGSGILYTSSAGCDQLVALNAGLFQEYDYNNEYEECDWRQ
jgi:hypothetical protein